jgi:pilus assembly protein Flp/PilA
MRSAHRHLQRCWTAVRERATLQEGQALIEYALILGLVAVLTIGVLQAMGANVSGLLNTLSSSMSSVSNP